jgi:hypothetical protein
MDNDYGRQGDKPLFKVEGAPDRHSVKSMFRGSDALGMDGRDNGT